MMSYLYVVIIVVFLAGIILVGSVIDNEDENLEQEQDNKEESN